MSERAPNKAGNEVRSITEGLPEWRPIKTAPRDYTPILAVENFTRVDDEGNPYPPEQMVVQWSKGSRSWASFGVLLDSFQPTHWMPLPAPPEVS